MNKSPNKSKLILVAVFMLLIFGACQAVTQLLDYPTQELTELDEIEVIPTDTVIERAQAEAGSIAASMPEIEYQPYEQETYGLSAEKQQRLFNDLWQTVNEEYLYVDFSGLDWQGIHTEYSAYIARGLSDQEFYFRMWETIYRLGDEHSIFMDPEMVAEEDALYAGDFEYVGLGVVTVYIPDPGFMTVEIVFPNSPAEAAGLMAHDNILALDGQSMKDLFDEELGMVPSLSDLAGRDEGEFTVQTPGEEPRTLTIPFEAVNIQYPVPAQVFTTTGGQQIGYIVLTTFSDLTIPDEFARQLEALGPLDGLILDNRINTGGYSNVVESVLQYFVSGEVGSFVSRNSARELTIEPLQIYASQDMPLVVLVGEGTVSFGEIFSGILKDQERATLIGNTTLGNIETLWGFELPYDTFLWIAHETFVPTNHPEEDWEQSGIIPHLEVDAPWHLFTPATDPAIQAALDHFDQ